MNTRIKTIERKIEGIAIYQRETDGYVNATQICKAHLEITGERKDTSNWLQTKMAQSAINKLSLVTGIPVTELIEVKQGGKYQGTWIHPRLAVRFTMWVNDDFSLFVEDWIHSWLGSGYTPAQMEADIDRIAMRDKLKNSSRTALTDQVKSFLEASNQYNPRSKETGIFFGRVHNEVNLVLTGEKASDMRQRLESSLGKPVSENELLRDYFPITDLADYAAICQTAANNIENGMHPINAIKMAAKQVLPPNHVPNPIDFTEKISFARYRLEQARRGRFYLEDEK
ncbi:MAG: KilA-N domain-containing protein [Woronichinia naegeliana WA131]|jgi:hypothetical protein|uniref:KilA-N domain-containing protein n=2 Tax=Woronichinia naegeliana WA131 TaxID=2824559 RepID=A0A977KUY4_9CYAN|nr:MAG: KilA-N domain-containing protein [Woronichinia naegeliana WA131]UXE59204.1 MAG: KilA-N domain-containing protein [Woronichinia naegeliana WA131]UXE59723.1 MAG: KilA-N domain-containing protein [Woronichinia naegeliana WA131]UXE60394.1 MAG: KilA-N domain-containing protein [Woronichinia naegeliana WA131]UXE63274.1 MAG: KilA-N domain-containing protein [Woronichinia naegeliana WA131]